MPDPRYEKWAAALTGFSTVVEPGMTVAITGGTAGEPLLRAIYTEVVKRGGFPVMLPAFTGLNADMFTFGSDEQLAYISPIERFVREQTDVAIFVIADSNTKALSGVDPARQLKFQSNRRELFQEYLRRDAAGEMQWTLTLFPTDSAAQDAEMSTADFEEFVLRGCKLHTHDPVAAWNELAAEQQRLIDWLTGKSDVHITGPDTDLTVSSAGRKWINADGRKNFPDGEVFTGPVETSANGHIRFSYPAIAGGREVEDIRLRFENGKVVEATAAKNEEFLIKQLDTDEGARYLGEFAFGTNFDIGKFTKNILFDEKIGGTVHMAVGAAYPETGSANQSAVHWDMICDLRQGGSIDVDGLPFMRDGKYVV
jgi:aminopeptidase